MAGVKSNYKSEQPLSTSIHFIHSESNCAVEASDPF